MPVEIAPTTISVITKSASAQDRNKTKLQVIQKHFKGLYPITELSKKPGITTCPNCFNSNIPGKVYVKNHNTVMAALILTPALLCWLPTNCKKFKSCVHFCPDCKILIGITPYNGICPKNDKKDEDKAI